MAVDYKKMEAVIQRVDKLPSLSSIDITALETWYSAAGNDV